MAANGQHPWRVGIDVGGTFTDVVALNEETGERRVHKTASTPADPSQGFISGLEELLDELGAQTDDVSFLSHGTTVATNAILEAKYATMGLIVTRGFREMLECARQTVPGDFGDYTWWQKPPRVVPLELIREAKGRLNFRGEEFEPIDEDEVRGLALEFKSMGINAIAVSLIHSYRNTEHEERVRDLVKEAYPECYVSISADVIREYREYERTLSTCLNTGLMPLLSSYVGSLEERLTAAGLTAPLYVMKSSGGIVRGPEIVTQPIAAVLSGPAAGVITAAHYSQLSDRPRIITLDVGGTSSDICLIDDGKPHMLTEGRIDIFDIKTPMVDIHTVGSGGGSIAWLTAGRSVRVGPQSAGADPGPVCYGKGGTEPTVTDAHLVLGRISPYLLAGAIDLDVEAARSAIASQIGEPLGLGVEEAASGVLEIAGANITQGINVVSVKRGRDPRDYALFAFGGAGGLNCCLVADMLQIDTVVLPPSPGVTSAEGLLFTDVRSDHVITDVQREDLLDIERLKQEYETVHGAVVEDLTREGFSQDQIVVEGFVDMRYAAQAYELRVQMLLDGGAMGEDVLLDAVRRFHGLHDDRYGYSYEGRELVEIVNIGATGLGVFARPELREIEADDLSWEKARTSLHSSYFKEAGGFAECPVYERSLAPVGERIQGPAVIEQYDATLVIEPSWAGELDALGQIVLTRESIGG